MSNQSHPRCKSWRLGEEHDCINPIHYSYKRFVCILDRKHDGEHELRCPYCAYIEMECKHERLTFYDTCIQCGKRIRRITS